MASRLTGCCKLVKLLFDWKSKLFSLLYLFFYNKLSYWWKIPDYSRKMHTGLVNKLKNKAVIGKDGSITPPHSKGAISNVFIPSRRANIACNQWWETLFRESHGSTVLLYVYNYFKMPEDASVWWANARLRCPTVWWELHLNSSNHTETVSWLKSETYLFHGRHSQNNFL